MQTRPLLHRRPTASRHFVSSLAVNGSLYIAKPDISPNKVARNLLRFNSMDIAQRTSSLPKHSPMVLADYGSTW